MKTKFAIFDGQFYSINFTEANEFISMAGENGALSITEASKKLQQITKNKHNSFIANTALISLNYQIKKLALSEVRKIAIDEQEAA